MRRRERTYALVLGTICTLGLLAGAWPLPLLAFALLELVLQRRLEHAGDRRRRARAAYARAARRYPAHPAGGILRGTP